MGALTSLKKLYLENNLLTGRIPGTLHHLKHLEMLKLHGNDLTGTVPSKVCDLRLNKDLAVFSVDCETELNCTCCTQCF